MDVTSTLYELDTSSPGLMGIKLQTCDSIDKELWFDRSNTAWVLRMFRRCSDAPFHFRTRRRRWAGDSLKVAGTDRPPGPIIWFSNERRKAPHAAYTTIGIPPLMHSQIIWELEVLQACSVRRGWRFVTVRHLQMPGEIGVVRFERRNLGAVAELVRRCVSAPEGEGALDAGEDHIGVRWEAGLPRFLVLENRRPEGARVLRFSRNVAAHVCVELERMAGLRE